jgi:hypothetical protein
LDFSPHELLLLPPPPPYQYPNQDNNNREANNNGPIEHSKRKLKDLERMLAEAEESSQTHDSTQRSDFNNVLLCSGIVPPLSQIEMR